MDWLAQCLSPAACRYSLLLLTPLFHRSAATNASLFIDSNPLPMLPCVVLTIFHLPQTLQKPFLSLFPALFCTRAKPIPFVSNHIRTLCVFTRDGIKRALLFYGSPLATGHSFILSLEGPLSSLESALTEFASLSRLESALTKKAGGGVALC